MGSIGTSYETGYNPTIGTPGDSTLGDPFSTSSAYLPGGVRLGAGTPGGNSINGGYANPAIGGIPRGNPLEANPYVRPAPPPAKPSEGSGGKPPTGSPYVNFSNYYLSLDDGTSTRESNTEQQRGRNKQLFAPQKGEVGDGVPVFPAEGEEEGGDDDGGE